MPKPLLFISHKHVDKEIALCVAEFIRNTTMGQIDVHLSSNAAFQGPRFGKEINGELRRALWSCEVLLLIYTSEDRGWEYCLWECGVATDSNSPNTSIIVFQCGADIPAVLGGTLCVDARDIPSLQRLCREFFTQTGFFHSMQGALAEGFEKQQTDEKAVELHGKLATVIPKHVTTKEWPTWPFMQVELPLSEVTGIKVAAQPDMLAELMKLVLERGTVSCLEPRVPRMFGLANLESKTALRSLATSWQAEYPGANLAWFHGCCQQIATAAAGKVLRVQPVSFPEAGGGAEFVPVVSRVRQFEWDNRICFDIYCYDFPARNVIPLAERMLKVYQFYWRNLKQLKAQNISLIDLNRELRSQQKKRVPLLDENMHPKSLVSGTRDPNSR